MAANSMKLYRLRMEQTPAYFTLADEVLLEFLEELQVEQIIWRQGLLSHYSLHGLNILTNGIVCILERGK